jgi:hypothetical protein
MNRNRQLEGSAAFECLLELAEADEVDTDLLREILWLITAHSDLMAFATAAERLLAILERIPESWAKVLEETGISPWKDTLEWVVDNKAMLASQIGGHFVRTVNTNKCNPIRGSGSSEFPFYAVLCEPLPAGADSEQFLLLSAHLLTAYVLALREHSTLSDYELNGPEKQWQFLPNSVAAAALAIRRLAEKKHLENLRELPVELPPEEFAEELESMALPEHADLARDRPNLYRFLQKAMGIIDWVEKSGGGGGGSTGGHQWVGGRLESGRLTIERTRTSSDEDPKGGWGSIDIVKFKSGSARKRNARLKSDLPPDEDDDEEVILSDFECETTKRDAGANARAARSKARHVAKSNQKLCWAYDGLAEQEIVKLASILNADLAKLLAKPTWTPEQLDTAEVLFALSGMLWTGSSLDRIADTRVCIESAKFDDSELALVVSEYRPFQWVRWRVRALRPDYKTDFNGTPDQLRATAASFDLPDLCGFAPVIDRLLENKRILRKLPLFQQDAQTLKAKTKRWLIQQFPDGRITLSKIEGMLWARLLQQTGDAAIASCVIGVKDSLASVRLHYTSPWVSDLQQHYRNAVQPLTALAYPDTADKMPPALPNLAPATVGARLCPTPTAVRSMFERLSNDIEKASDYYDRSGFAEYHNLLTLFTVQFFAYSTTCRAIVTPYLPFSEIDTRRGIATLSDKDDETKHKTRLIWISETLREHMVFYDGHLMSLKHQMFDLPKSMRLEPCLFVDQHLNGLLVRPKTIEPLLRRYLNVCANTHRRFLRTELLERCCPPEVVDAFMGHWQVGEEPFGIFSSFSFQDYVVTLQQYLEPLLHEIGLTRPIVGRLAK